MRPSKIIYYLDIAQTVSKRSTCLRRNFGAVIVNNDRIVSTGYNGAPKGRENCCDTGLCARDDLGIPKGQRYELCRSVHAEANAIIAASPANMKGATLYLTGVDAKTGEIDGSVEPCMMCKRLIINSGISYVIVRKGSSRVVDFDAYVVDDWVKDENGSDKYGKEK